MLCAAVTPQTPEAAPRAVWAVLSDDGEALRLMLYRERKALRRSRPNRSERSGGPANCLRRRCADMTDDASGVERLTRLDFQGKQFKTQVVCVIIVRWMTRYGPSDSCMPGKRYGALK